MIAERKVSQLHNNRVYEDICIFLKELEANSGNDGTRKAYESDIREFFRVTRGKPEKQEINFLTEDDLVYKRNEILEYRQYLIAKGDLCNLTINRKITALKSLFDNLAANDYELNTKIFDFKALKSKVNSYGNLSQTEAERFAETALITERQAKDEKRLLILFAIRTSLRVSEILNVQWDDITQKDGVYVITSVGKGQKERSVAISDKFYNELISLKQEDSEYVFNVSKDSINDMMQRIKTELNIDPKRNITFHSFRKVAIDWEIENTGSYKKAIMQSGHSSMDILHKHYVDKNIDYSQLAGVRMDEEEIEVAFDENITLDDFKEFILNGDSKLKREFESFCKNKLSRTVSE
jgi:integrase